MYNENYKPPIDWHELAAVAKEMRELGKGADHLHFANRCASLVEALLYPRKPVMPPMMRTAGGQPL